jgi:hypothetical protein
VLLLLLLLLQMLLLQAQWPLAGLAFAAEVAAGAAAAGTQTSLRRLAIV